ncbi:MAG: hypothetical protein ABI460_03795 [Caldimonas sp.]
MESALRSVASHLDKARFLIVNVTQIDVPSLASTIKAFHAAGGVPRLCLAGDRKTLSAVAAAGLDDHRIGLMLDHVDVSTACSDLIWDRIGAVRFDAEFIACAARDVRKACALEAMLGLAREVGLRTLGFSSKPGGASPSGRYAFDYLPTSVTSAAQSPPRETPLGRVHAHGIETLNR